MTERTRRQFFGVAGGVLLGAGLAACGGSADAGGASGGSGGGARTLRVATFPKNHAAAPLFWPQFAPEGWSVEVTTLASGTEMNQALERGDLDFALFGLVNGFVQAEEGIASKIVAMAAQRGASLVVKADSAFRTVGDLRGKKIGFKGPAFQYLLLLELLDKVGLDGRTDVTLVPVEWNDMPAALARGDLDAYMGTEPNPARSVADGSGRRLEGVYETPAGSLNSVIWASRAAAADKDMVEAAGLMQKAAAEKLSPGGRRNDPAVWKDLAVTQFGYEEKVYEALLPNVGAVWDLDDTWRAQAKAQGDRMVAVGLLKTAPDLDRLLVLDQLPTG